MAVFFAVIIGITVLCVCVVSQKPSEERVEIKKDFDRTIAEGLRLWNPKLGVDSVRLDSCRVEKMRMGAFRLGGFNMLRLDGLVLNLPLDTEDSGVKSEEFKVKSGERGAADAFVGMLPRSFFQSAGVSARRFSGIQIRGIAVNRVENRREVPVFAADEARNRGRTLEFKNCRVFEPGRTNLVRVARLVLQPAPALVWEGGELKLDDLFLNLN